MGIDLNKRLSHEQIEALVVERIAADKPYARRAAFARVLKAVGLFVRDYAGGHDYIEQAASLLHSEISRIGDNRAWLDMTVGELLSLYVDCQPGLMDFGKERGVVPLDERNERDNQYRRDQ